MCLPGWSVLYIPSSRGSEGTQKRAWVQRAEAALSKGSSESEEKLGQEKGLGSKRWSSHSCRVSQRNGFPSTKDIWWERSRSLRASSDFSRPFQSQDVKAKFAHSFKVKLNPFIRKVMVVRQWFISSEWKWGNGGKEPDYKMNYHHSCKFSCLFCSPPTLPKHLPSLNSAPQKSQIPGTHSGPSPSFFCQPRPFS